MTRSNPVRGGRPRSLPIRLCLLSLVLAGVLSLGLAGCSSKPPAGTSPSSEAPAVDPNSMHGTGGRFLIDPDTQIRWSYAGLPTPEPSGRPNYLLKSFLFEAGSASLNAEARGALGDLADMLAEKPDVTILCLGLCDGDREKVNAQNLGMNRAQAARTFLVERGIDKTRIEIASFGSSVAQAPPQETIGQRLDRKVEVWLLTE